MKYRIRYTPAAQKDMDAVWDGVLEASASYDIADKYVEEFADKIATINGFPRIRNPALLSGTFYWILFG